MLESRLPIVLNAIVSIDDIRLRLISSTTDTIELTKKPFLDPTGLYWLPFTAFGGKPEGFVQNIPGTCRSEESINITGTYKLHL